MTIDLEKLAIVKLLSDNDVEFFHSLNSVYFTGISYLIFNAIGKYYTEYGKLPSTDELSILERESISINDWIAIYSDIDVENNLIREELENQAARNTYLDFTLETLDEVGTLSAEDIAEKMSEIQLRLGDIETTSNDTIVDAVDIDSEEDALEVFTSGFSKKFDEEAGGFASQEFIIIGGERGSGKSIISQNLANYHYEIHKRSVAYFNIEMSSANVRERWLSQLSGVSYSAIKRKTTTDIQKMAIEIAKAKFLYQDTEQLHEVISEYKDCLDKDLFNNRLKYCKRNEHKYFFIDDASLSMTKLDYIITRLKQQHDLGLVVVDYINIIKDDIRSKEQDWLIQQHKAEHLKEIAKKHDITLISPYQIHSDGSAKRAKAIEDSADRSFKFFAKIDPSTGLKDRIMQVYQSKARDNSEFPFSIQMNWDTLTLEDAPENTEFDTTERKGLRQA